METELQPESQDQGQRLSTLLNSSDIQLVPYVESNQGWTLPDNVLFNFAALAIRDRVFGTTFYDGTVNSAHGFVSSMKGITNHPIFAFSEDGDPLGFGWLNGVTGNYAFAHFCSLRVAWGDTAINGAKMILEYWLSLSSDLEFIMGMIPGSNVRAMKFIERLGFVRVGEVPDMLVNLGDRDSSVFFYYSRFDHA